MEVIILIVISIALLYTAFKFRLNTKKILKTGREAEGVIFDFVQNNNMQNQAKYPIIRFITSEKEWITEAYNIAVPGFFKKGQKVIIVYNPDNPKEFIVKSAITSIAPVLIILLAIIILTIGVYKLLHIQL